MNSTLRKGAQKNSSVKLTPYLLILPAFVTLVVILVYPMFYNIFLSFFNWRFTSMPRFVGLDNFIRLFTGDESFWQVLTFSLKFVFITLSADLLIGVASALILYRIVKGRQVIITMLLLPYMVAPIAVGLIWKLLWAKDFGLVNYFLGFLGIQAVNWLGNSTFATWAVYIPEIWRSLPFSMLILLAGLLAIPEDVYEAARIDGSSAWQTFFRITLPLLSPSITIVLLFQTVFKLRVFDLIFNLTGGGPGIATMPIGLMVYRTYFKYFEGGYAAAQNVILLLLGALISVIYLRYVYREVSY